MANRRNIKSSRGNTRRRPSSSRRQGGKREIWPFIVIALLIGVAALSVYACRHSENEPTPPSDDDSIYGSVHYPDLEITRYANATDARGSIRKDYTGFSLSFNPDNVTPDWVGWELLRDETSGNQSRNNRFWTDSTLPGCPTTDDYKNSGYDRGHMCPAADQKWSADAMRDCFVMANMIPQIHDLNGGAWQTLETKERLWAQRDSAIVIVAGPIYAPTDRERIGASGVRVPSAFFKVLLAPYVENPRAIGFVYPNAASPGNMESYAMSVDEVERLTGLDFFSSLPDEIEDRIENIFSFTEWNRKGKRQ